MKDLNSPMRPVIYLTKEFGFSKKKKSQKCWKRRLIKGNFKD